MALHCHCRKCRPIGFRTTYTEEFRHECEVRMLAAKTQEERDEWIAGKRGVKNLRGEESAIRLITDLILLGAWSRH